MHRRVLPREPIREKCYLAFINQAPVSSVHRDSTEYVWFPVVSRRNSGQTVMLAFPAASGTTADCLAEFPEFSPYFPYIDLDILTMSSLDNYNYWIIIIIQLQQMPGCSKCSPWQERKMQRMHELLNK